MASSIRAVAEAAGVSKTTVSFVMNNTRPQVDRIPEETCERVRACAAALGYSHNPIAASLRTGKRVWIGVMTEVLPTDRRTWEWAPFFDVSLLYGVQRRLADLGYFTLLALRKPENEVQDMDQLTSAKIGGLILRAADDVAVKKAEHLIAAGVPVVNVFPRQPSDLFPYTVDLDNRLAGRLAGDLVVRSRCTNPAFLTVENRGHAVRDRENGFIDTIKRELKVEPGMCELPLKPESTIIDSERSIRIISDFIHRNRPDALVVMDGGPSMVLNGVLDSIDVDVPGKMSVIGFDSFLCSNSKYRSLSSVGVSWLHAGEVAAQIVVDQVRTGESEPLPRLIAPAFVPGDTTPQGLIHELAVENLTSFIMPSVGVIKGCD